MMRTLRDRLMACGLLLVIGLTTGVAVRTAEPVLTDEDIVRMFVSGVSESEIVRRIGVSQVEFDLSDEMLDELALAGIPETILKAMQQREAELRPPEPAPEIDAETIGEGSVLRIRLNPDWTAEPDAPRPRVRLMDMIDPATYEALQLRNEVTRFTDLAIVLACLTADHVPDHWRSKSPLGRDFNSMPRHRVLVFVPGATRSDAGALHKSLRGPARRDRDSEKPGVLSLEIPEFLEVELEPGVAHDLLLGLAARADDRYMLLTRELRSDVVLADQPLELQAVIGDGKSLGPAGLSIGFLERQTPSEGADEASPGH